MKPPLEIYQWLAERNETLSVAESCTGGGLANCITLIPGISRVFLGSVTAYANSAKESLLRIPSELILRHGAVSEEIGLMMAKNCREIFNSTWALSTTGIAGPSGGSEFKPIGLVYIGLAGPKNAYANQYNFSPCTRLAHRERTIAQALAMLKKELSAR